MPYNHPIHRANAYEEFTSLRTEFAARAPTHPLLLRMCRGARMAGCYALLMDADAQELGRSLQVSGRAFGHFLPLIPEDQRIASRAAPFLDAIACGDVDGASLISRNLAGTWRPELEYEEDFLFVQFLSELSFRSRDEGVCRKLLAAYERVIGVASDPRFDLARALLDRDAPELDSTLRVLIDRHRDHYCRMAAEAALPETDILSEGNVFLEGLALIRLAERRGMILDANYPLIPSLIRGDLSGKVAAEEWRTY